MFHLEIEAFLKSIEPNYEISTNNVASLKCWIDIKNFTTSMISKKNSNLETQKTFVYENINELFAEHLVINEALFKLRHMNQKNIYKFVLAENKITTAKEYMFYTKNYTHFFKKDYDFLLLEMTRVNEYLLQHQLKTIFETSSPLTKKNWKFILDRYSELCKNLRRKDTFLIKECDKLKWRVQKIKNKKNV